MAQADTSTKRLAVTKANAQMVIIISVASFVTVFCLFAAKAVWSQTRYQARVTSKDETAHQQLQKNIQAFDTLVSSYNKFDSATTNIIGGSANGSGNNDGTNAAIILDALPDQYNFPALASTIEKILTSGNFDVSNITGTDDQIAEQGNTQSSSPSPVSMPFSFGVTNASYASVQQLINTLQSSIRPMAIDSLTLSGGSSDMTLNINAHTYYQPGKKVSITQQVVK
jgi:hypothetical protein